MQIHNSSTETRARTPSPYKMFLYTYWVSDRTKTALHTHCRWRTQMHKHTSYGISVTQAALIAPHIKESVLSLPISALSASSLRPLHLINAPPPPPPPLFFFLQSITGNDSQLPSLLIWSLCTLSASVAFGSAFIPFLVLTWWVSPFALFFLLPSSLVCPMVTSQGSLRHAACLFCSPLLFQEPASLSLSVSHTHIQTHTNTHRALPLTLCSFPRSTCFPCF